MEKLITGDIHVCSHGRNYLLWRILGHLSAQDFQQKFHRLGNSLGHCNVLILYFFLHARLSVNSLTNHLQERKEFHARLID